jgi:hypothetical protein
MKNDQFSPAQIAGILKGFDNCKQLKKLPGNMDYIEQPGYLNP